jgi:enolase
MAVIKNIKARQILDSRGNPTVECDVVTEGGLFRAAVPSGASTGSHEALELRDGDKAHFKGKGVLKAVKNINEVIARELKGEDVSRQQAIDRRMMEIDGTENKSSLGANAIVAVSMAAAKAGASAAGVPLYLYLASFGGNSSPVMPVPQLNVLNGGKHAGLENDIQEHMIMPVGAKDFAEALRMAAETYQTLKSDIKKRFGARATAIADEGGFVPDITDVGERLELIEKAVDEAGYKGKIKLALDSASSEFFSGGKYTVGDKSYTSGEFVEFYKGLADSYPLISVEDGMAEDDWDGWVALTESLGKKLQIVGDDLLVTNPERIKKAIEKKAVNAVLIKINQIGSVSETIDAINMTKTNGWNAVVSHRSGETEDSFMADLAVGLGCGQIKSGAPARSERNCKYNQLLRIAEELSEKGNEEYFRME